jgi:hypothetical protein
VSLDESLRYEIKIPCEVHLLPQIQAWVRLHPAHWRVAYPPRQVNNIYFDSADFQSFNENLDGEGERGKLRLRWYGPILETVAGAHWELKYKEGATGWKASSPFGATLDLRQLSWAEVLQALREAADARTGLWLAQLACPVLINCYQRDYYVTSDNAVRLTFDTDPRAYDQRFTDRPNLRRPAPIADHIVIELKAAIDCQPQLSEVLANFPARPDRHSKYIQGMLAAPDFDDIALM